MMKIAILNILGLLVTEIVYASKPVSFNTKAFSFTSDEADRDLALSEVFSSEVGNDELLDEVVDMTWCMRISLNSLHHQSIITGANIGHNIIKPKPVRGSVFLKGVSFVFLAKHTEIWPEYWVPECLAYNHKKKTLALTIKGELVMFKSGDELDPVLASRKFTLPYKDNILFSPSKKNMPYGEAFTGLAADFYLWNRTLSLAEMERYTTDCTHIPDRKGLIIDWSKLAPIQTSLIRAIASVDVCQSRLGTGESSVGIVPIEVSFAEAEASCLRMGGKLADHNEADFVDLMARADPTGLRCSSHLWTPYQKSSRSNMLFNTNSKKAFLANETDFSWQPGQPNGGDLETCLTIHIIDNEETVWDDDCEETHCCFACHFNTLPKITVRGDVCSSSVIDRDYFLVTYKANIFFRGFFGTKLQLNGDNKWAIVSDTDGAVGYVNGEGITPMGKRQWNFINCSAAANKMSLIKTTQCKEDEFTCDDGTCISLLHRCDEISHCLDLSDEDDCFKVSLNKKNYRKEMAPSAVTFLNKELDIKEKVQIQVSVFVDKVTKIQELEMSMRVKYSVSFSWFDQRLTFKHLKKDAKLNTLLGHEVNSIWFPPLTFDNAMDDRKIVPDAWSRMYVKRIGLGYYNNHVIEPDEALLFKGDANEIVFTRDYEHNFNCQFNLDLYPFDTQSCDMFITTANSQHLNNQIGLKMGKLTMSPIENLTLAQFAVTEFKMLQYNSTDVAIHLTFKRSLLYHFVTTYIPTTCLIIICQATLFVEGSHHFETVTMVTLTAKLVLFTAYQTISATLPRTARLKLIDVWFLFGFLTCFFVFLVHVVIEVMSSTYKGNIVLRKKKILPRNNQESVATPHIISNSTWLVAGHKSNNTGVNKNPISNRIKMVARILFPLFTGIFMITYWISAIVRSNNA